RHLPGGFLCPAVEISVSAATTARATRPGRLDDLPLLRLAGVATAAACHLAKRLEQIDWEGEHGGRIVLGRDLGERLQVAKLERDRAFAHYFRRLGQALRHLKFALGRDHLGAPIARCMSCGRSMFLSSTSMTLIPHGSVWASTIAWMRALTLSRWLKSSSSSVCPPTERSVVCASCMVANR